MSEPDAIMVGRAVEIIREEMQAALRMDECRRGSVEIQRLRDFWAPRLARRIVHKTFAEALSPNASTGPVACGECD
ncbi:MAG: hypothetical protein ACO3LT_09780 [Ilumatobacteraceae bacterium]